MPRSRSRPKKHSKSNRVSVKRNHKKIPRPSAFDRSKLDYDPKETQFANYQKLGLLYDANQIGAERKQIKGFKPRVKGPSAEPAAPGDVHQLELEVPEGLKTVKKVRLVLVVIKVQKENPPQLLVIRVIKEIKVEQVQEQRERRVLDHQLQLE